MQLKAAQLDTPGHIPGGGRDTGKTLPEPQTAAAPYARPYMARWTTRGFGTGLIVPFPTIIWIWLPL